MKRGILHNLTAEQRREIVRLYVEELESAPTIGRRMYCSCSTIRRVLAAEGVPRRPAGGNLYPRSTNVTQDSVDRAVELYLSGHSTRGVAAIMGVGFNTARNRLLRAGVAPRTNQEGVALQYRAKVAWGASLNARQRAALECVENDDSDQPTTTAKVAQAIGASAQAARATLHQLEGYGLLKVRPTGRPGVRQRWSRTDLAVRDVLDHALAPPPQRRAGEVWLPIEPFRDWLERIIDVEQRLMLHISTDEDNGIAPTPGAARVATRLHLNDRRLYALRYEQRSVTLSMADQCLLWGDGTTLEDLWPELGSDEEVARLPRSYQQRDRQLEAAA